MVLDEMAEWEQEVFEREYADMNWYKGKQEKYVKQIENGRKRGTLGRYLLPFFWLCLLTSFPSPQPEPRYSARKVHQMVDQKKAKDVRKGKGKAKEVRDTSSEEKEEENLKERRRSKGKGKEKEGE